MKKADPVLNYEEFPHLSYAVVKIEKADLPSGGSDGTCYRYVVANSVSSVTGYRQGTKREVTQYCATPDRRSQPQNYSQEESLATTRVRLADPTKTDSSSKLRTF